MHLSKMDQHAAYKTTHQTNKKFIMRTAGHRLAIFPVESMNVTGVTLKSVLGVVRGHQKISPFDR